MHTYETVVTMHNGVKFTVGRFYCKSASEASKNAKMYYPGHKSYKSVKVI